MAVMENVKLRVKESHKASFDYSVAFKKGDMVKVGNEDPEMPSWFWCENKDGVWSWIPEEFLTRKGSEGSTTHGYDTTELTVAIGETLEYLRKVKLWTLCRTHEGKEGWVPTRKLKCLHE